MQNVSSADDLLLYCWSRSGFCKPCLDASDGPGPCAWCPYVCSIIFPLLIFTWLTASRQSSTCVPNPHHPLLLPILTPIKNADICPLWYERWEVRARVTGCYVSPVTFLVLCGAIAGTLLFCLLVWLSIKLGRLTVRRWKTRQDSWWRFWSWRPHLDLIGRFSRLRRTENDNERQPLLVNGVDHA